MGILFVLRGGRRQNPIRPDQLHRATGLSMFGLLDYRWPLSVGGNIAKSSGAFFFVWTLIALGVTALFSVILSARGLWTLLWGQRQSNNPNMEGPSHGGVDRG